MKKPSLLFFLLIFILGLCAQNVDTSSIEPGNTRISTIDEAFPLDSITGSPLLKAFNGIQGLELAKQAMPDLIILDLAMPEMDGWQTAKLLKQDPHTKDIPIIALTAYTLPGDKQQALDSGCDGYLSKPLHVANFAAEVATYFVH